MRYVSIKLTTFCTNHFVVCKKSTIFAPKIRITGFWTRQINNTKIEYKDDVYV